MTETLCVYSLQLLVPSIHGLMLVHRLQLMRGNVNPIGHFERCVRRRAKLALELVPHCKQAAQRHVEKVFTSCFANRQPFDSTGAGADACSNTSSSASDPGSPASGSTHEHNGRSEKDREDEEQATKQPRQQTS